MGKKTKEYYAIESNRNVRVHCPHNTYQISKDSLPKKLNYVSGYKKTK